MLCSRSRVFGDVAGTYLLLPADGGCRLVVKLLANAPRPGPIGFVYRVSLPYGDLVMMRKQLLTLKRLAEETAAAGESAAEATAAV